MKNIELKKIIKKLPQNSGIYIFSARGGSQPEADQPLAGAKTFGRKKILYIGKALNLKKRLSNYLKTEDQRILKMLSEAKKLDFIETDSEIEALILESQYIKKYKPQFNIILRDDKQYSFVVFTGSKYQKIFTTHQPQNYKEIIGPFTDAGALKTTLHLLRRIFPYCTCEQLHNNYCLNYHIGKCLGYCCLKNKDDSRFTIYDLRIYKNNIDAIKDILSGKKSSLIKNLEKEMRMLSKKQEFEKAKELQYKIEKLKKVFQNAQIIQRDANIPAYRQAGELHVPIAKQSRILDFSTNQNNLGKIGTNDTNNTNALKQLKKVFKLSRIPNRIESYDIANIQGKFAVGAMAVFINGQPDKNEYRKFKIYTKQTPDDTAMLHEILTRRFNHLPSAVHSEASAKEWAYPDLIVIDGGKGQLNAAQKAIYGSSTSIMVIALTKNEKHMGHKIIMANGEEVSLSKLPIQVKNLLLHINAEAHRFAINYYRNLHKKSLQ